MNVRRVRRALTSVVETKNESAKIFSLVVLAEYARKEVVGTRPINVGL